MLDRNWADSEHLLDRCSVDAGKMLGRPGQRLADVGQMLGRSWVGFWVDAEKMLGRQMLSRCWADAG